MKIKVLGAHNTESGRTRYPCLLVDGILALDAGGLTSSLSFRDQIKIKALLLTHHHYDHIRDIPAFAMNLFLREKSVDLFTHQVAYDTLIKYLLDGEIYPNFHQRPQDNPTLKMHIVEPGRELAIEGYRITPVPVSHSIPSVGYQIKSPSGKTIFYTGDTGFNVNELWQQISPQVLFSEVTAANRWEESAKESKHLTPNLLKQALNHLRETRMYLPRIVAVHINPESEKEIQREISEVAASLKADISLAYEGMVVEV